MEKETGIISLVGFMGSGKSRIGRELSRLTGSRLVDLDQRIVDMEGRSIPEIFSDGEAAFRKAEYRALASLLDGYRKDGRSENLVLALGGGTFTIRESRELVLAGTVSVYLRTRLETIRARIGATDASRPLFADADRLYRERCPIYSQARYVIDTDDLEPRDIALGIISMTGLYR